ncbi:hypothetical protein Cpha266_1618 [Chlorobium phaeobacteroides DSM 266]|uniref:Uncharacterized protein n=1 Tax=Chlorobium phaeobacteroides (strain DSM 266 / SMG 266 / 2430) TaxID=290317 RepID=A1BGW2_CHLPD|nr:hypothetical protein Cpha266_1618 [Chlorobium phaeobacteroides DSM 266]
MSVKASRRKAWKEPTPHEERAKARFRCRFTLKPLPEQLSAWRASACLPRHTTIVRTFRKGCECTTAAKQKSSRDATRSPCFSHSETPIQQVIAEGSTTNPLQQKHIYALRLSCNIPPGSLHSVTPYAPLRYTLRQKPRLHAPQGDDRSRSINLSGVNRGRCITKIMYKPPEAEYSFT